MIGHEERSKRAVKVMAVLLFLAEVGIMFAYGFGTTINIATTTTTDGSSLLIFYTLTAILAILGWGLIIAYSENSAVSGLMTTLMTVGLSVQLQPLLIAFWNYAFSSFNGKYPLDLVDEKATMAMCVSLLIALCSLSGRLGIVETFTVIICFNVGWPLNFYFVNYLKTNKWTNDLKEISDAIGSTYIYLFAGVFSLIVSIFLNLKEGNRTGYSGSRQSAFIGMIGTGFAFAASPFTGMPGSTVAAAFESALNVYFTLTASVITTYAFSAIFGNMKVGVRESLVGVLGGVAIIGSVSAFINNIGGCIAIGAFAGLVSGFWLRYAHPRVNSTKTYDQIGIIGPITINAFFGVTFVAPLLYGAYKNADFTPAELTFKVVNERPSTYFLAIFGVTMLIGLGMGLITGIITYLTRDAGDDFHYGKLVSTDFGLYRDEGRAPNSPAI